MLSLTRSYRPAGRAAEFEALFAVRGPWWCLVQGQPGHLGTLVVASGDGTYLVTDSWESEPAYETFAARFAADRASIDAYATAMSEPWLIPTYAG